MAPYTTKEVIITDAVAVRFKARIGDPVWPNDCWPWIGSKSMQGYGHININRRPVGAHRVSYELFIGPIPKGMFICHTCDRCDCVNPYHLFVGTPQDNVLDSMNKNRSQRPVIGT